MYLNVHWSHSLINWKPFQAETHSIYTFKCENLVSAYKLVLFIDLMETWTTNQMLIQQVYYHGNLGNSFRKWNLEKYVWTMLCLPSFSLTRSFKDEALGCEENMCSRFQTMFHHMFLECNSEKVFLGWQVSCSDTGTHSYASSAQEQHRHTTSYSTLTFTPRVKNRQWTLKDDVGLWEETGTGQVALQGFIFELFWCGTAT